MFEYIYLIPVGITIAALASTMGIGGGLLWAPFLILVVKLDISYVVMLSLLIQIVGMASSTVTYFRKGMLYWKLARSMLPFMLIGIALGVFLNKIVAHTNAIELGLGVISMFIALFFSFQTENYDARLNTDHNVVAPLWLRFSSFFFASISALFSIGIGDFLIPLFRGKLKIPMPNSVGTSLFLNFVVAASAGIVHFILTPDIPTQVYLIYLYAAIGVALGGQLGPFISSHVTEARLKELFVFILMMIGLHLIYQSL